MELNDFKNQEKYNLFVTSETGAWEAEYYIMPIDRCLTSYTSPEIGIEYGLFENRGVIEEIKKYPCIFAYEDGCKSDSYIGYITDMTVRKVGMKFSYKIIRKISFESLHALTFELDIVMSRGITELMHTHWTIKNVNLFLEINKATETVTKVHKPTIFISYSWTPKENKDRVIALAERLENQGVNVLYDKKSLLPGQDMNAFMESLAINSEIKKVLVICNSDYASKADNRRGGVGTEAEIIIPQVYGNPMQNKIVPIFFEMDKDGELFRPVYLRSRLGIDFTNDYEEGYKLLIEDIFR